MLTILKTEYTNGSVYIRENNLKASTQLVDNLLRSFVIVVVVAVDCSLYFVVETVASNSKAVAKIATPVMCMRTFAGVTVESNCGFAEAMALVECKYVIVEEMVMVGNSYGTAEAMGTFESSFGIAEAMVKAESSCLAEVAEETTANNFVAFEASVSSVSNWQVAEEKAENT